MTSTRAGDADCTGFCCYELKLSVQLFADLDDTLGQEIVGDLAFHRFRQDGGSRGHRGVGRGRTHIGQRLGFGERDLAFGGLGAPDDKIFHLGLGFGRDALGFGLCGCDDVLRLAFRAGMAGLVFREHFGRLVLEATGVVELGLDAVAAMVQRLEHGAVDAEVSEHPHQDDEGDGDPEFRFFEHQDYPFKEASTALLTVLRSGARPVSRCTIAMAASEAMLRTLLIAASRVAAMVFSASASLTDSRSSSVLRSASEAALSFSRVSVPIACARERAAASSLS